METRSVVIWLAVIAVVCAVVLFLFNKPARAESGIASVYATLTDGYAGRRTANGERAQPEGRTCAHKWLPFGTRLRVCRGDRCTVCRVNDRGPYVPGRIIDLTPIGARALGFSGLARVTLERL